MTYSSEYRLPVALTDFIAESMCGILETQPPRSYNWDFVPLPELVLFVEKVTSKAKIDVPTAISSLILVSRFKDGLPKNAHGEYGTCHKIFLSSLLVALKKSQGDEDVDEEHPMDDLAALDQSNNMILSSTPSSVHSMVSLFSEDEEPAVLSSAPYTNYKRNNAMNQKFSDISGIYNIQEINTMERDFRRYLGQNDWVTDKDIQEYVENNKYALGLC